MAQADASLGDDGQVGVVHVVVGYAVGILDAQVEVTVFLDDRDVMLDARGEEPLHEVVRLQVRALEPRVVPGNAGRATRVHAAAWGRYRPPPG